jgi:hypothetical protein
LVEIPASVSMFVLAAQVVDPTVAAMTLQREVRTIRKSATATSAKIGRSEEVAALLTAARAVLENRAFTDAARAILRACQAILSADAGFVALTSPGEKCIEIACLEPGRLGLGLAGGLPAPLIRLTARAAKTGQCVSAANMANPHPETVPADDRTTLESALVAPVIIAGDVAGVVGLLTSSGDSLPPTPSSPRSLPR